tara:strand:+ start:283 stop:429 length:147 start_codon:yes stop_codon:yes gene_type:complete
MKIFGELDRNGGVERDGVVLRRWDELKGRGVDGEWCGREVLRSVELGR